ncbi:hypothetical protein B0J11DRAFT_541899 [Dendryphion nanum]|uniref:Transmembrane protein n=1 Tax=Dendryphion nanum TaxID=256645 RepID=A0A9P9D5W1_9PLEO|nr:hypothetical protein B0J11DRAFT_541899 [Dendryphion nanum]
MPNKQGWSLPLNVFLGLFFTVLFSLLFEQWSTYNTLPNWLLQAFRHFIYFLILTLYLGMGFVSSAWFSIFRHNMYDAPLLFFSPILVSISVGVYLVLCAVDAYWLDPGMGREVETRAEDTEV